MCTTTNCKSFFLVSSAWYNFYTDEYSEAMKNFLERKGKEPDLHIFQGVPGDFKVVL